MNAMSKVAEKVVGRAETKVKSTEPMRDPVKTMYALRWYGKYDIRYEQVHRPLVTENTDAVIRITATTICGSDLHLYDGTFPDMHTGDILGHECMGIVEAVGSECKKLKPGMRVVVSFDITCGTCEYCKAKNFTACSGTNPSKLQEKMYGHRTSGMFGYTHLTGGYPGSQAGWVRVPFADNNCLPVPAELPDEKALSLSDIIPTSYFGTDLAGVKEGSTVAVWGLGPVGQLICRWAQIRGAKTVIGIDCVPERLKLAKERLGIHVIDFKNQKVYDRLMELTDDGPECCIEAAGPDYPIHITQKVQLAVGMETDTSDIVAEMIMCCKKFGTVSIIGAYSGYTNGFPIGAMMEKALTMNGGQCPVQRYWPTCLKHLLSGEMDPTFVVSHRASLSEGPELYKRFFNKEAGILKLFIRPTEYTETATGSTRA